MARRKVVYARSRRKRGGHLLSDSDNPAIILPYLYAKGSK